MDSLKIRQDKNFQLYNEESKSIVKDCLTKVKKFQANVVKFDLQQLEISANISDLPRDSSSKSLRGLVLKMMAEINIMLSENLYVCTKELASLKQQWFLFILLYIENESEFWLLVFAENLIEIWLENNDTIILLK